MTAPAPFCPAHPGGTFEACEDCAKARGDRWAWLAQRRVGDNPLTSDQIQHYATKLRRLLATLDRQIVDAVLVGDREGDLLGAERQEVDRVREFLDSRIGVGFQIDGLRGRDLALLDALRDELITTEHDSPSIGGPDAPTSVLASEPIVGAASGAASPAAPGAFPITRAERLVLAADVVPLHDFTLPGAPLTGYRARMQGEHISPRWIGEPHRTRAAAERDVHDLIGVAS